MEDADEALQRALAASLGQPIEEPQPA